MHAWLVISARLIIRARLVIRARLIIRAWLVIRARLEMTHARFSAISIIRGTSSFFREVVKIFEK